MSYLLLATILCYYASVAAADCPVAALPCPNPDITFYLSTRSVNMSLISENNIDPTLLRGSKVVVVIHGWKQSSTTFPNTVLVPSILTAADYNVIVVDYSAFAGPDCYVQATMSVDVISTCLSRLLRSIYAAKPTLNSRNTHIIGHSLGAQVAGYTGRKITELIARITGLDPASILFDSYLAPLNIYTTLNSRDASFVDLLHTDANGFGAPSPRGTVDFYLNKGYNQPSCTDGFTVVDRCSHFKSVDVFASTTSGSLTGVSCNYFPLGRTLNIDFCSPAIFGTTAQFGLFAPTTSRGTYRISQ